MTAAYVLTEPAEEDLEPAFELLATHPEIGRLREELAPEPYRFWPVGPSLVVYRADLKPIQIIHVGRSRDWARMLSST